MNLVLQPDHSKLWIWLYRLLPVLWFAGLISGIVFFIKATPNSFPWMRGGTSVSIVCLLVSAFLPFLISAFAVVFFKPWLLAVVCFFKAFLFSLVSMLLLTGWGEGSWLIQRFFMFHEICSIPILYAFWRRCFVFRGLPPVTECILWGSLVILIVSMNYCVVSPFYSGLTIL